MEASSLRRAATVTEHPSVAEPTRAPERSKVSDPRLVPDAAAVHTTWVAGQWWALIGGGFALFWAYVLIRWVTGPYFHNVSGGPTPLPLYMKISTITWQAAAVPVVGLMFWKMGLRHWLRDRVIATDGLFVLAFLVLMWQDPVSSYFGHWYTYNSHMFNMGAFTNDIPGWRAFGAPGAQQAYPILFMILAYPGAFFVGCWLGAWAIRLAQKLRPHGGVFQGIVAAVAINMLFDLILEGFFWCPLGFYSMPGGHLSLFPDTYHKFPFHEMPTVGMLFGLPAALRYYKNDQGETFVERGISKLNVGVKRKGLLRLLALIAATQLIYLVVYQIPVGGYVAANPGVWPKDVQDRSYLNDHLCGTGTNRLCPGPGIPLTNNAWVNTKGQLQGTAAKFQFQVTPVLHTAGPGPYTGRFIANGSR